MSEIKVLTTAKEATEYEISDKYVTVDIVKEGNHKYGIFKLKDEPKEAPKEVKKNDKK